VQAHSKTSGGFGYYSDGRGCWADCDLWVSPGYEVDICIKSMPEIKDIEALLDDKRRIETADLSYPIILTPDYDMADGYHRVAAALLAGKTHIRAKILDKMPKPFRKVSFVERVKNWINSILIVRFS
jgi:hypothetical protein